MLTTQRRPATTMLTEEEQTLVRRAAAIERRSISAFIGLAAVDAAERVVAIDEARVRGSNPFAMVAHGLI